MYVFVYAGDTYYYHTTRELTTWVRPQEEDGHDDDTITQEGPIVQLQNHQDREGRRRNRKAGQPKHHTLSRTHPHTRMLTYTLAHASNNEAHAERGHTLTVGDAVCCRVMLSVAVRCRVSQSLVVCCNVLQSVVEFFLFFGVCVLQSVALQSVAECCRVLQCLQHTAMQHSATRNTHM